jgi:hypothetical protein
MTIPMTLTAGTFKNGCFHLHVKDGEIQNAFSHLTLREGEYVLHMKVEKVYSPQEFVASHPPDADELKIEPKQKIHNLAGNSIVA